MKIYKAVYDAQRPSAKQVTAPLDSTFGVAVGVVDGGEKVDLGINDVKVNGVSAQAVLDGGFALFALASGDEPGGARMPVKWTGADKSRDFELIVSYAEQGVIEGYGDGGGGDVPADVATKSWVQQQIDGFVDADDVSAYVAQETSSFVDESDLTAYATKDELTGYVEESDLTAYATKDYVAQETSSFVEDSDLTAYATKDYVGQETSSYVDADGARQALSGTTLSASQAKGWTVDFGITGHDDPEGLGTEAPGLTAIQTCYESEWEAEISADAVWYPNTMFVVLPDPE